MTCYKDKNNSLGLRQMLLVGGENQFAQFGVCWLDVVVRAARVQNETAPEKFLNRCEKRFEKREKGSEKRSETRLKNF